jgi:hypothetical protein
MPGLLIKEEPKKILSHLAHPEHENYGLHFSPAAGLQAFRNLFLL